MSNSRRKIESEPLITIVKRASRLEEILRPMVQGTSPPSRRETEILAPTKMSVVMGDARVAGNDLTESAQPTWEAAAFPAQRHKRSALLAVM